MKFSYTFTIIISVIVLFIFFCTNTNVIANEQLTIHRGDTLQISVRLLMNGTYVDPVPHQVIEFFDETNNKFIDSSVTD